MPDTLEPQDELGHSSLDYQRIASSLNDDIRTFARRWLRECLDSVLLRHDDPKGYSELSYTVTQVFDATILYLIAEGYLEVTEKALDDTEATEQRVKEWADAYREAEAERERRKAMLAQMGAAQGAPTTGLPSHAGMYV